MEKKYLDIITEHADRFPRGKQEIISRDNILARFEERLNAMINGKSLTSDLMELYGAGGNGKSVFLVELYAELVKRSDCFVVKYDFERGCGAVQFLKYLADTLYEENPGNFSFPFFDRAFWQNEKNNDNDNKVGKYAFRYSSFLKEHSGIETVMDTASDYSSKINLFSKIAKNVDEGISAVKYMLSVDWKDYEREKVRMAGLPNDALVKEMPAYLIRDISNCNIKNKKPLVILLDSFECLQSSGMDISWLINPVNGLICSIPGVLWVVAGRDRVKEGVFKYRSVSGGSSEMPLFTEDETRTYLKNAMIDENLTDSILEITKCSPFMLDFVVSLYMSFLEENWDEKDECIEMFGKKLVYDTSGSSRIRIKDIKELKSFDEIIELYLDRLGAEQKKIFYMLASLEKWDEEIINRLLDNIIAYDDEETVDRYKKAYKTLCAERYIHMLDTDETNESEEKDDCRIWQFERPLAEYVEYLQEKKDSDMKYDKQFRKEVLEHALSAAAEIAEDYSHENRERSQAASTLIIHYLTCMRDEEGFIKGFESVEELLNVLSMESKTLISTQDIFYSLYKYAAERFGEDSAAVAVIALYFSRTYVFLFDNVFQEDDADNNLHAWDLVKNAHDILKDKEKYRCEYVLAKILRADHQKAIGISETEMLEDINIAMNEAENLLSSSLPNIALILKGFMDNLLSYKGDREKDIKKKAFDLSCLIFDYNKKNSDSISLVQYGDQLDMALTALEASEEENDDYYICAMKIRDNMIEVLLNFPVDPLTLSIGQRTYYYAKFIIKLEELVDETFEKDEETYRKVKYKINLDWKSWYEQNLANNMSGWDDICSKDDRERKAGLIISDYDNILSYCKKAEEYAEDLEYINKIEDSYREEMLDFLFNEDGTLRYSIEDLYTIRRIKSVMKNDDSRYEYLSNIESEIIKSLKNC
ncbi:MAG: hypothetical protein K5668_08780 [Lachnospiraceae bacterium]|nr:hypothetical protein [Lachnospiraceae bacterium]